MSKFKFAKLITVMYVLFYLIAAVYSFIYSKITNEISVLAYWIINPFLILLTSLTDPMDPHPIISVRIFGDVLRAFGLFIYQCNTQLIKTLGPLWGEMVYYLVTGLLIYLIIGITLDLLVGLIKNKEAPGTRNEKVEGRQLPFPKRLARL